MNILLVQVRVKSFVDQLIVILTPNEVFSRATM